jgi:hypothetical protein
MNIKKWCMKGKRGLQRRKLFWKKKQDCRNKRDKRGYQRRKLFWKKGRKHGILKDKG